MKLRALMLSSLIACSLAACGGGDAVQPNQSAGPTKLLASSNTVGATFVFPGRRAEYKVAPANTNEFSVTLLSDIRQSWKYPNGSLLRFADGSVSLDIDGLPSKAYRLYEAALNRVPDGEGLGYWLDRMERGMSIDDVALAFTQSDEYKRVFGVNPTNKEIVSRFYSNVLNRDGDDAGISFWTSALNAHKITVPQVLLSFSNSVENKAAIAPALKNGVQLYEVGDVYPPIARVASAQISGLVADQVMLDGTSSIIRADKTPVYQWVLSSKPANSNAVLNFGNYPRPNFFADVAGDYEVTLVVGDGVRNSPSVKSMITIANSGTSAPPPNENFVYLRSMPGEVVSDGQSYVYTRTNSLFNITPEATGLRIDVQQGQTSWLGKFKTGSGILTKGTYPVSNLPGGSNAISWIGKTTCAQTTGSFTIDKVVYDGATLSELAMRFTQYCNGSPIPLEAQIYWSVANGGNSSGPDFPIPANLWNTDQQGAKNYLRLESSGEYIGRGKNYMYYDSDITVKVAESHLTVLAGGILDWSSDFEAMKPLTKVIVGYYHDLPRYPLKERETATMDFRGQGRGCNTLKGWYVIDKVTYAGEKMIELDMRFEQLCEGDTRPLNGKLHWTLANETP